LNKYDNDHITLVDDRLTILHEAKKIRPTVVTIWVKRGKYAMAQGAIDGFAADAVIEDLGELINITERLFNNEN
jgi:hypothetical protein